jgi:transcriptional regulator with XRE-family HTH domain
MREWFRDNNIPQADVASALNKSVSAVSRLVNGQRVIRLIDAKILHECFGVPYALMMPDNSVSEDSASSQPVPPLQEVA